MENEKTFDLINQVRQFEGQKPLGGFQEFMKEYPQLFLTMGHTGRDTPKEGKMAGFDLRNVPTRIQLYIRAKAKLNVVAHQNGLTQTVARYSNNHHLQRDFPIGSNFVQGEFYYE